MTAITRLTVLIPEGEPAHWWHRARQNRRGADALPALMEKSRTAFGMRTVALLSRSDGEVLAHCADRATTEHPDDEETPHETTEVPVGADAVLVLTGRRLPAADQRVLTAFAAHVGAALERD
ncbi:hypothetical protein ACF1GP_18855, partial [Kitasatospora aureofaciens]